MICPHCKKSISYEISDADKARIKALVKEGYSVREVEKIMFAEGVQVSFSTVSRLTRKKAKP